MVKKQTKQELKEQCSHGDWSIYDETQNEIDDYQFWFTGQCDECGCLLKIICTIDFDKIEPLDTEESQECMRISKEENEEESKDNKKHPKPISKEDWDVDFNGTDEDYSAFQ